MSSEEIDSTTKQENGGAQFPANTTASISANSQKRKLSQDDSSSDDAKRLRANNGGVNNAPASSNTDAAPQIVVGEQGPPAVSGSADPAAVVKVEIKEEPAEHAEEGTEVKTEPDEAAVKEEATSSVRDSCQYGIKCYRSLGFNELQKKIFFEFVEANPFYRGLTNAVTYLQTYRPKWLELCTKLNENGPPTYLPHLWRKIWKEHMNVIDPDHVKKALPYAVFDEEIAKYREMKKKRRKGVRKENDLNTTAENVELCSSNNGVEPVSHCEKASTTAQKDKNISTQPQFEITIKDLDEEETSLTEKQTTSEQNNTVHAKMGSNSDQIQTRRPTTSKNSQLEQSRKQEAKSKVGKASSIENRNPKQVQLRKHSNTECSSIKQLEVDNPTDKPMTIRRENEKPVALALHSRYKIIKQGEPKGNIVDPVVPKSLSESINKPTYSLESKSEMRLAENPKAIQLSIPNNASELANQRQQVPSTSQKDIHMESKAARNLNKTVPPNTGNQPRGKQNNEVLGKMSGNASQMQKINTTFKSRELPKEIKKQKATNMVEKAIPIGNFNPKQVQLKAQLKTEISSRNQLETDNDNKTQSVCGVKTTVKIASIQREKPPEQPIVAISPSGSKHKPTHLLESRSEITSKATGTSHVETETGRKETAISTLWEDDDMIIITPRTELEQIEVMDSITALLSDERFSQPNNHGRSMPKIPPSNSESENSINQQLDEDEDVIIIDCDIKTKNPVNSSVDEENILEVVDLDNDTGVAGSSNKTNLNDSISEDDDDVIISAISLSMDLLNAEHNSHTQNVMGGVERTVNSIERIPNKCMNSDQRKLLLQTMAKRNALKAEKIKLLDRGKRSLTEYRRKKLDLYLRKANAIEKEARLAKEKSIKALIM